MCLAAARTTSLPPSQLHRLYGSTPHSWMHHVTAHCSCTHCIAACLTAAHTILLCASQLHTPHCCAPHSCTHHVAAHLAAVQATLLSPLQLPGHVAASLAAPNKYQVFIKTWYSTCTWLNMMGILTTQHKMPGTKGTCHPNPKKPLPGMPGRGILGLG